MADEISIEIALRRISASIAEVADLLAGKPVERELHEGEIRRSEFDEEANQSRKCLMAFHEECRGEYALHDCTCACHDEGIEDD